MFGARYFGTFYFAAHYWGHGGPAPLTQAATLTLVSGFIGSTTP